jgi:hypothetical protein
MFWGYAYLTASYIYNRIPNSKVKTCPLQKLYGVEPNPNKLYPFGAKAIVQIPAERRTKLNERAQHGRLIGYPEAGGGWLIYSSRKRRIIHSTSVVFPEYQHLPVKKNTKKGDLDFILNQITLKLGKEETKVFARDEQKIIAKLELTQDRRLPSNIRKALAGQDSKLWEDAAKYEMKKFDKIEVWEPVKPFQGVKTLGWRWDFAIKPGTQGEPETFCARYVAKGFNQKMGVDCNETYAPTASLNTLRLLISLANKKQYPTATFDVSSAYLYSPIEEEVYIQPPTEIFPELKGKIMKLKKAMYGTKQAARCWWQFFKGKMEIAGFVASELKPSLYIYRREHEFVIIWLHVDDRFSLALNQDLLNNLKGKMEKTMKIKWSDLLTRLVGIDFKKNRRTVELSQEKLATQIVQDYQRPFVKHGSKLPDEPLEIHSGEAIGPMEYRSIIGSMMYLAGGTQPDMAYAVNLLARYSANPSTKHWEALDYLVGYLKGTTGMKLKFNGEEEGLDLWTDANWGGEHERSTSGFVVKMCGDSVAWGAKRQTVVALSTCAAEYISLSDGAQHLASISILLDDIQHNFKMKIYCHNEAAILVAGNNASKKKTRYLIRAFYFINDFVRANNIKIQWTSTINQQADIFTKKSGPNKMEAAIKKLGLGA